MAGRPKGLPKTGGGSRKGIPNKHTADIRQMIKDSLELAGGTAYLVAQAKANPGAYMGLVGKVVPKEVEATVVASINFLSAFDD